MRRTEGVLALAFLALTLPAAAADPVPSPGGPPPAERDFITRHWRGAIPPQGSAPARFSPIERSLQPETCGACHPVQFSDWQTSLHSKSMGPDIAGQLVEMARREPAAARSCSRCHAPVTEQRPELYEAGQLVANRPGFDHAFPTYVTPQVRVRVELVDGDNQSVAGSVEERVMPGRCRSTSRARSPTRAFHRAAGSPSTTRAASAPGLRLRVTVRALPDESYTRFFEALPVAGAGASEEQIREALEATRRSAYTLYVRELPPT